ncbi:ABC transporter ATP-binding protein [Paenibacillus soyae]|uniref:ABC transporter ATP-binding protein n=1 Tax=Paenibacillus soyae TaxID=2969249 RepID=A0A9X2SBV8_9BACL|nr:ABC transporter ATP-binding protein [Paenibacillus soyae]MCR2807621.1 ABC transporter ATP-binding protein [Paenibacillus soyae]
MLELEGLFKSYNNASLSIESLTVQTGAIVGLLGANGAGKTTLLKTIMGLTELEQGTVSWNGRPIREQYAETAFMTEEGSIPADMSAADFTGFLADFYPRFDRVRYRQLLDFFELDDRIKFRKLSRGQRSKLEICAGFSKGAKLILMDEPFQGKDVFARRDFLKLMVTSLKEDETFLIATHLVDEIEHVIDRAVVMHGGRIRADLTMDELHDRGMTLEELLAEASGYDGERYRRFIQS